MLWTTIRHSGSKSRRDETPTKDTEEKLELGGWEARAGSGNKGTEVWSKED